MSDEPDGSIEAGTPERREWRVEERETLFRRFHRIDRLLLRHELFGGGTSRAFDRELFVRGSVAAVLPHDPRRDTVALVEQFRPGTLEHPRGPWQLEVIAGMLDGREPPEAAIRREAVEEAGVTLGTLVPIAHYYTSPGASDEQVYLYYAETDLSDARSGQLFGLREENEDIRLHVLGADEAIARLDDGTVCNAISVIGLQWFARERLCGRRIRLPG